MRRLPESRVCTNGAVVAPRVVPVLSVVLRDATSYGAGCARRSFSAPSAAPTAWPCSSLPFSALAARTRSRLPRSAGVLDGVCARLRTRTSPVWQHGYPACYPEHHIVAAWQGEGASPRVPVERAAGSDQLACTEQARRAWQHHCRHGSSKARHQHFRLSRSTHVAIGRLDKDVGGAHRATHSARGAYVAAGAGVDYPAPSRNHTAVSARPRGATRWACSSLHLARTQDDCGSGGIGLPVAARRGLGV